MERVRDLTKLPKAHLHLHFTGSMRPQTLLELADKHGVRLPDALTGAEPPAAARHRRAGLVPLPAALRRRPELPP
jgi:adenosine deaminase